MTSIGMSLMMKFNVSKSVTRSEQGRTAGRMYNLQSRDIGVGIIGENDGKYAVAKRNNPILLCGGTRKSWIIVAEAR
jgi:hypothetical protein